MKLTDWYPGTTKPVRIGWYQRQYNIYAQRIRQDWWDGSIWYYRYTGNNTIRWHQSGQQSIPWRGIKRT